MAQRLHIRRLWQHCEQSCLLESLSYGLRGVAELQVVCLAIRRVCIYTVSSYITSVEMQMYRAAESLAVVCHVLATCYRIDAVPDARDITLHCHEHCTSICTWKTNKCIAPIQDKEL